jgi:hypothetical protein
MSTPTPTVTHKSGKPISVPPKVPTASPSATPSPSVLGVGPTLAPGTTGNAAGAPVSTTDTKNRAREIAIAAFTIAVVGLATIRVLRRRSHA